MNADWMDEAACAAPEVDPEWFFPDKWQSPAPALAVCRRCPVKARCLNAALAEPVIGIWGGMTDDRRAALRHNRTPATNDRRTWLIRYTELRDLGYSDMNILDRMGIKPDSMVRQMIRYGITPSRELANASASRVYRRAKSKRAVAM